MIIVSHRGPATFVRREDGSFEVRRGSGGLAGTVGRLVHERFDEPVGWVAAALTDDDRAAAGAGQASLPDVALELLDIDPREHRLHYDLVSNATLWFLHHGLFDLPRRPRFDDRFREAWDAYVAVNRAFADRVAAVAEHGDIVLVQDYHLALVPGELTARRADLRVVFFTHTPFCGPNSMRVLPDDVGRAICESMATVPCGFHTARWARAYEACVDTVLGPDHALAPTFAAPLGPDPADLAEALDSPEGQSAQEELDRYLGDRRLLVRSDRIDPSKNIVRGFLAYDHLLDHEPQWRERLVFLARLNASRQGLPEYQAYAQEVEQAAAAVNERWARGDWQPVVTDLRDDFPRSVAAYARYDALLVNPLRDGLNLVAKEGPMMNRRGGVVCLSPEAGAYDELAPAVLPAHPYDIDQTARALHTALSMPADSRRDQATRLRALAGAHTPATWLQAQISEACA